MNAWGNYDDVIAQMRSVGLLLMALRSDGCAAARSKAIASSAAGTSCMNCLWPTARMCSLASLAFGVEQRKTLKD